MSLQEMWTLYSPQRWIIRKLKQQWNEEGDNQFYHLIYAQYIVYILENKIHKILTMQANLSMYSSIKLFFRILLFLR